MSIFGSYGIGRLTEDPKLRQVTIAGVEVPVCDFSIAINYGFGESEKTEFINCTAWRKVGEIIGNYCKKGRKIYVSGHQQTRNYEIEKDGVTFRQYRTEWTVDEFEFCDSVPTGSESTQEEPAGNVAPNKRSPF